MHNFLLLLVSAKTPTMDRLAGKGAHLEMAYGTASPLPRQFFREAGTNGK